MTHSIHPVAATVEEVRAFEAAAAPVAVAAPDGVLKTIGALLNEAMNAAVKNGASSISMPDDYVELAVWLAAAESGNWATDDRAAFEAWIAKDCGDLSTFGSGKNIHYRNSAVNNAWTGWQAHAALAAAPAAPVVLPEPAPTLSRSMFATQREYADAMEQYRKDWAEIEAEHALPAGVSAPVLYVSKEQLDSHRDPDGPDSFGAGRYLPARITPAGKFTTPLFAAPQAPAADALDAARYRGMRDKLYGENISIGEATLMFKVTGNCPDISEFDAGIDAAIAAQAAAQGGA